MHVFTYVFVTLRILQSQLIEKGFEHNVVLLLFLFTLESFPFNVSVQGLYADTAQTLCMA